MTRLAWCLAGLMTAHLAAQQGVLRSTVIGVRLVVRVSAGSQAVLDLAASDFTVTDAGVPQAVDASQRTDGLSLALVVDTSFSLRRFGSPYAAVRGAASQAVAALTPRDHAAVVTVSDHATVIQPSTADRGAIDAALASLPTSPLGFTQQTALWDGLMVAASQCVNGSGTPAVLAFTDGKDNASWLPRADVGRLLERQGVAVDVVGAETSGTFLIFGFDDYALGPVQMPSDITHDSGGQYFDSKDSKLGEKLRARFDELRSSYILTYTPRGVKLDDGWHKVTVKVPGRNVTVKAQPGYFASK